MKGTHFTGLKGTNPLGFLAALGVQVAFASESDQPKLWWSDDITPHAVVDDYFSVEQIADQAMEIFDQWAKSPTVGASREPNSPIIKGDIDKLKLKADGIRQYLNLARKNNFSASLATALVAEGSLDRQGVAKPSDFYFTAGQQAFLKMIREILRGVSRKDLLEGLNGPWKYESSLPSLMWDISDDRMYALRAGDPTKEKKLSNPGPEALAILGLSLYPVFSNRDKTRTLTQGCWGRWNQGFFSWPLWCRPASLNSVRSLLAHSYNHPKVPENRQLWFRSWGISKILRSAIRRSSQGGYGTFGPPDITWNM